MRQVSINVTSLYDPLESEYMHWNYVVQFFLPVLIAGTTYSMV